MRTVLGRDTIRDWHGALAAPSSTAKNGDRILLEKHLADYTAKNTFDYFIHKDLGAFLRRELDFFLKNEVLHLDDVDTDNERDVDQYLGRLRAIKRIGHKIIAFLAQLEDFQKRLFLKKKFVLAAEYCVTLDRVPESLHERILTNDAQWAEWERLFTISELPESPDRAAILRAQPLLVLDTKFFDPAFKHHLLASFDDLDSALDGLLINSENFQAINLLQARYAERVKCIYIDPPYNTGNDGFIYRDNYRHSSWLTMMQDRFESAREVLRSDAFLFASVDENEIDRLPFLLQAVFPVRVASVTVQTNPKGRGQDRYLATSHDYLLGVALTEDARLCGLRRDDASVEEDFPYSDEGGHYDLRELRNTHRQFNRSTRQNLWYPLYVDTETGEVSLDQTKGLVEVFPLWSDGLEGCWTWGRPLARQNRHLLVCRRVNGTRKIYRKAYAEKDGQVSTTTPKTIWNESQVRTDVGQQELDAVLSERSFPSPKPLGLISQVIQLAAGRGDTTFDYFAGSGTTGHAVINLNREDGGTRKYLLVEMGEYFDSVLKPRILKVIYSKDWRDGKPVSREGSSHLLKYLTIESYEDTLNNLRLREKPAEQKALLDRNERAREEYLISYSLDMETTGSPSLLDLDAFSTPFDYELVVTQGGESRTVGVDLPETFNYLLGLRVQKVRCHGVFRTVEGIDPEGQRVLVVWRSLTDPAANDEALARLYRDQGYAARPPETALDRVYVNGDTTLADSLTGTTVPEILLTEDAFHRLMFAATAGVA